MQSREHTIHASPQGILAPDQYEVPTRPGSLPDNIVEGEKPKTPRPPGPGTRDQDKESNSQDAERLRRDENSQA